MSRVWSCNEWDQLEEVIIGNPLNARFPTPDRSTQVAEFPDRSLAEIPRGPFPQQVIEETEEDLSEFARILEGLGVAVKRPQTWPHEATFSTVHWESRDITIIVPAIFFWSSATRSSRRQTSCAAARRRHSAIAGC